MSVHQFTSNFILQDNVNISSCDVVAKRDVTVGMFVSRFANLCGVLRDWDDMDQRYDVFYEMVAQRCRPKCPPLLVGLVLWRLVHSYSWHRHRKKHQQKSRSIKEAERKLICLCVKGLCCCPQASWSLSAQSNVTLNDCNTTFVYAVLYSHVVTQSYYLVEIWHIFC